MKHLISTEQFTNTGQLEQIFKLTDHYQKIGVSETLKNKIIACIFYEPSTRTRLSFETAALRLGAQVISTENAAQFSSAAKGETLEDTIKVISSYADAIVLRHFEKGASKRASLVSSVPIINAGDGAGEHPTQALLDIYTILKELGRLNDLKIALVGDLLNGRTIHSLINLLSLYDSNTLYLISPRELRLSDIYLKYLKSKKIKFIETADLSSALQHIDVLYMTRVQKERIESIKEYEKVKNAYSLNNQDVKKMKQGSIIMHPLPRVNEISPDIDNDKRATYFRQAKNGLYVRMAILDLFLNKEKYDH
ncbi:MAG: aspartate carbamoyltransferase [Candidatus Berkelbacteria bacterium]|nr:aspartate carbamoyltransferase [Candidatus Berkelbacteria bacterium]